VKQSFHVDAWRAFLGDGPGHSDEIATLQGCLAKHFPLAIGTSGYEMHLMQVTVDLPRSDPATCVSTGDTYYSRVTCLVDMRSTKSSISETSSSYVLQLSVPAVTPAGSFIIKGQEKYLVGARRLAPGLVMSCGKRLSERLSTKGETGVFAAVVSDDFKQILFRYLPGFDVDVNAGSSDWFPVATLFRVLGAATERDLLHWFCATRLFSGRNDDVQSLEDFVVLARDVVVSTGLAEESIVLHKAGETVSREVVRTLVGSGVPCSVYRWRRRVRVDESELDPSFAQGRWELATGIADDTSGEPLCPAWTRLDPQKLTILREHQVNELEIVGNNTVELVNAVRRMWRKEAQTSRVEALSTLASAFNFDRYDDVSVRRTIDVMLAPPIFTLTHEARDRFSRITARGLSGSDGIVREDLVALVARLIEVGHGCSPCEESGRLDNFIISGVASLASVGLERGFSALSSTLWREYKDVEPDLSRVKDIVDRIMTQHVTQHVTECSTPVTSSGSNQLELIAEKIVDDDPAIDLDWRVRKLFDAPHPSWYGRFCYLDSGVDAANRQWRRLATHARVGPDGVVYAPYYQIVNGRRGEVLWLGPADDWDKAIAPANAHWLNYTDHEIDHNLTELVDCRIKGEVALVELGKVALADVSPVQFVSLQIAGVPYFAHTSPGSILRGACSTRDAVKLDKGERPRIVVELDSVVGDVRNDASPTQRLSGVHLRTAYLSWYGENFGSSVVVSQEVVSAGKLKSVERHNFCVSISQVLSGCGFFREWALDDIDWIDEHPLLDAAGILRIGSEVRRGDILVGLQRPGARSPTRHQVLLGAIVELDLRLFAAAPIRDSQGHEGRVDDLRIEVDSSRTASRIRAAIDAAIAATRHRVMTKTLERCHQLLLGAYVTKGLREIDSGAGPTKLDKKLLHLVEMPALAAGAIRTTNTEINARIKRLTNGYKAILRECDATERYWNMPNRISVEDAVDRAKLRVCLSECKPLRVGDVIHTRHGGGGVVTRIVPKEDMPFDDTGEAVELILNPLSVVAENRVGELLEGLVARAAFLSNRYIRLSPFSRGDDSVALFLFQCACLDQIMASQNQNKGELNRLGSSLYDLAWSLIRNHRSWQSDERINKLVIDHLDAIESINHTDQEKNSDHSKGLDFTLKRVQSTLLRFGITPDGRCRLRDGRSGDDFASPIMMGMPYVHRCRESKDQGMTARSTGEYSFSGQPNLAATINAAQKMDQGAILSLAAFGAAYFLRELSTIKSDDMVGRVEMFEALVKGDVPVDPIIAGSTQSMLLIMSALGINITLGRRPTREVAGPTASDTSEN
jgi:DNA-directed RNA polymerase beta subunit